MKNINKYNLVKNKIDRIIIYPFKYHNNWYDKQWFINFIHSIISKDEKIIILAMRENNYYLEKEEISLLRNKIIQKNSFEKLEIVEKLDQSRIKCVAELVNKDKMAEVLYNCWNYFEYLNFFVVKKDLQLNEILSYKDLLFNFDFIINVIENWSDKIIGKTLENEELKVDIKVNDLKTINYLSQLTHYVAKL